MAFKTFYLKIGRLRFYDGTGTPLFLEVPFRGTITAPVDRPRPAETMQLDRGRITDQMHYVVADDSAIVAPLPFACSFRLANTEPNFLKFLTLIRVAAAGGAKTVGGNVWATTKATTQVRSADPLGSALHTTPVFADPEKFCLNIEALWEDPDNASDRGFQWAEVYLPPDRQLTEGDADVTVDLSGEIYGNITLITAFTAGTES